MAAAIAAVSMAARGLGGPGRPSFATGSPDCCVCPVCRVIAAMREPSPELSERLASGAGDLAVAVTSLLRAFSARPGGPQDEPEPEPDEGDTFWAAMRRQARGHDDLWAAATAAQTTDAQATAAQTTAPPAPAVKKVAKKAVKKAVKKATPEGREQ